LVRSRRAPIDPAATIATTTLRRIIAAPRGSASRLTYPRSDKVTALLEAPLDVR
jgi:hypothetical protein